MSYFDSTDFIPDVPMAAEWVANAWLGPCYMGFMVHFVLYGILVNQFQAYVLSRNHRHDTKFNQVYIWLVVVLDTAHVGVNVYEAYFHGISQDRTANAVFMTTIPDALPPVMVGTIGALVQGYLSVRASRLFARRRVLRGFFLGIVFLMIFVAWVASVGACVANLAYTFGFEDDLLPLTYNSLAGIWLWLAAGVDLVVTATLILGMRAHVLGFNKSTDGAIKQVIKVAMLTASFTSVFGVIGALFATIFPQSQVQTANALFAVDLPLSSLYALSLLVTLDCRQRVQQLRGVTATSPFDRQAAQIQTKGSVMSLSRTISRICRGSDPEGDKHGAGAGAGVRVLVETSQEVDEDRTVHGGRKRRVTVVMPKGERFLGVPGTVAGLGAGSGSGLAVPVVAVPPRRPSVAFSIGGSLVELDREPVTEPLG